MFGVFRIKIFKLSCRYLILRINSDDLRISKTIENNIISLDELFIGIPQVFDKIEKCSKQNIKKIPYNCYILLNTQTKLLTVSRIYVYLQMCKLIILL